MSLDQAAVLLAHLADAIPESISPHLLDRDIKPQNILLDKRSHPLLADFGLSTTFANSAASTFLMDVMPTGTPAYMAPEQWEGHVGKASDIYALGVVIYQLITGKVPFQG